MFKRVGAVLILFALITIAMFYAINDEDEVKTVSSGEIGIEVGQRAPDFELATLSGETVKLSDYRGQKVMLNFWATWCPPCRAEMPDMEKFYHEMKGEIEILAINIDTNNDVAGFIKEMGVTFPILLDTKENVMKNYQIISIPTTFLIDENGIIKEKTIGAMTYDYMKKIYKGL